MLESEGQLIPENRIPEDPIKAFILLILDRLNISFAPSEGLTGTTNSGLALDPSVSDPVPPPEHGPAPNPKPVLG